MKKLLIAVAIFCTYSVASVAQDSTWKSTKKQKNMYKSNKDSMGMWSDTTMQKGKMWKKDKMNKMEKNRNGDTSRMPMSRRDTLK